MAKTVGEKLNTVISFTTFYCLQYVVCLWPELLALPM